MSYAVIQTGGKQYKVKAGEILKVEKLHELKPSSTVNFDEVLAYGDDSKIEIGTPLISGAKVEANLIKNSKNRTVLIFKKRRRKNSRKKNGHRQQHSKIQITKILSKDGKIISESKLQTVQKQVKPSEKTKEIKKKIPVKKIKKNK